jgi:methylmalonyl-CoA mutase N-terminal domain/subunit
MEEIAYQYFVKIDELGGMVEAIKTGFPQREIADAAFRYQQEVESGVRKVVGVNSYTEGDDRETPILRIDPESEREQVQRVRAVRERRDAPRADDALERLERAAREPDVNLMPYLVEAARAEATEGEMVQALQRVFGTYTDSPAF